MEFGSVALYMGLGLLVLTNELRRIRSRRPFNLLSVVSLLFLLLYVAVPLVAAVAGPITVRQKFVYQEWGLGDAGTAAILLFSYIACWFGYRMGDRCGKSSANGLLQSPEPRGRLWLIFAVMSLLGILGLIHQMLLVGGGPVQVLTSAAGLRSGAIEVRHPTLFLGHLRYFIATAFVVLFALYLRYTPDEEDRMKRLTFNVVLFSFGLVFVYFAVSGNGLRLFAVPVGLCAAMALFSGPRPNRSGLAVLVSLTVCWVVVSGYAIRPVANPELPESAAASETVTPVAPTRGSKPSHFRSNNAGLPLRVARGLSDSFMHFVAAEQAGFLRFGFLTDIRALPRVILPSQLLNIEEPPAMYRETAEFMLGRPLEEGRAGEEPLGLHGYLLVNLSAPGLLAAFALFGWLLNKLDRSLRPKTRGDPVAWMIFGMVSVTIAEFFRDGVVSLLLIPYMSWWILIAVLFSSRFLASREAV